MVVNGRSTNREASDLIQEAMLCKMFGCLPSKLRKEKYEDIVHFSIVYEEIMKKNPLYMFT
ncbi:MAG: hypothetical protein ACOYWZ_17400 [Bacillota bacterium]